MFENSHRILSSEKRLLNCETVDVNQLMPIRYVWAWEHYLNGCANNWLPSEVPMEDDRMLWRSPDGLTGEERKVLLRSCGFFSTGESIVATNISLALYKYVTNAEARQYLLRQAFEEAVHAHAFLYICESLGLDSGEIFNMYREVAVVKNKELFALDLTRDLLESNISTKTFEGAQKFLENLVGYYLILEGIFFYGGFAMVLSFQRQNKMRGIAQIYEFILRDETIHLNFGIDLINGIKEENPELWTPAFQQRVLDKMKTAVELEVLFAEETLPHGIFGLTAPLMREYTEYLADRRLERVGLPLHYHTENPFPWMSEVMDLYKEKNFFEKTVTEYRSSGTLEWKS